MVDDSVYQSEKDENNEQPMLLDPCVAEDVKLLSFLGNRVVSATDDELGKEEKFGRISNNCLRSMTPGILASPVVFAS